MKFEDHSRFAAGTVPAWCHSFPAPRTFSLLWIFERISVLGVPLALAGLIAAGMHLGWIVD